MLPAMSVETKVPHLVFTNSNLKFHYSLPTIIYKLPKVTCQKFNSKLTWVFRWTKKFDKKAHNKKFTDGKTHLKMPGKPTQLKPTAKDEGTKKEWGTDWGEAEERSRSCSGPPKLSSAAVTTLCLPEMRCTLLAWLREVRMLGHPHLLKKIY